MKQRLIHRWIVVAATVMSASALIWTFAQPVVADESPAAESGQTGVQSQTASVEPVKRSVDRADVSVRRAGVMPPAEATDGSADYFYDLNGNGACVLTVTGSNDGDRLPSVIRTGDVNGDGIADIVATADGAENPNTFESNVGACYIFFGGPSLTGDSISASDADVIIYGKSSGDRLGYGLALADINNDDTTDIIVSADGAGLGGEVYVLFGTADWSSTIDLSITPPGIVFTGPPDGGNFDTQAGTSLATGDVNGDGLVDILIFSPGAESLHGTDVSATWVVAGRPTWQPNYPLDISDVPYFGEPASAIISGIDTADAYYESPPMSSSYYLYAGDVVSAADVNRDGIDDILIALPGGDGPANVGNQRGEIRVVYGFPELGLYQPDPVNSPWLYVQDTIFLENSTDLVIYGQTDFDRMGHVNAHDVNGDTWPDIVIPTRFGDGPGEARPDCGEVGVFFANTSFAAELTTPTDADMYVAGRDADDRMEISALGDLDGDLQPEWYVSSYFGDGPDNARSNCGEVKLFARPDTLAGTIDLATAVVDATIFGSQPDDDIGVFSGLCAADVTGDGRDDLIVGAAFALDTLGGTIGKIFVVDGTKFRTGDADSDAVDDLCDNCINDVNPSQADGNGNGIGDACDVCCIGQRGDINGDSSDADPVDLSYLVDFLFASGMPPMCPEEADLNADLRSGDPVDLSYLVDYLFSSGAAPELCP